MIDNLVRACLREKRRGDQDAVGAGIHRPFGQRDDLAGAAVRDARDHGDPTGRGVGDGAKHLDALVGSECRKLAVGAAHHESVHSMFENRADVQGKAVQVDFQVLLHRCDEHDLNTTQLASQLLGLHLAGSSGRNAWGAHILREPVFPPVTPGPGTGAHADGVSFARR